MKSPGIGKFAQAALRAAAGDSVFTELVFTVASGCLSFTTGFGLQASSLSAPQGAKIHIEGIAQSRFKYALQR